jgi:hypothetical protein
MPIPSIPTYFSQNKINNQINNNGGPTAVSNRCGYDVCKNGAKNNSEFDFPNIHEMEN